MIKDIYIRNPEDPNFKLNVLDHSDEIESIISKIRMILSTKKGQVIGDINFGVGIEDLVFETKLNKMRLEEDIKKQINAYVSETSDYKISPSISFGKTNGYDYCVVDIYIDDEKVFGLLIK